VAYSELVVKAQTALADPAFQLHNARSSQFALWRDWLSAPPGIDRDALEKIAEIAVATLCLPDFQIHPLAGDTPSPGLVVLGDSDGGLFGVMTERIPWFDAWLSDGLGRRRERYGYGRNMFRMTDVDVTQLLSALTITEHCQSAPQPEVCLETLTRLTLLLTEARTKFDRAVVVAESG
jgi:hypothetical protein